MLYFDIETDGLLDTLTTLHCMCIYDDETEKMYRYNPNTVSNGVKKLIKALYNNVKICGHNIINFDIPALEKLYPDFKVPYKQYLYYL